MNRRTLSYLLLLWIFPLPVFAEILEMVCSAPGQAEGEAVVLDTGERVVRQGRKLGNIGLVTADKIYYYTRRGKNIVSYRMDLTDGVVDTASSKSPPDIGYIHGKLVCRKQ